VACALVAAAGCARPPPAPEPLTIAAADLPHGSLLLLALANGELERAGLDARVDHHPFGKPALDALVAGRADVASCADTPAALAAVAGHPIAIVAEISSATQNTVVLARRAVVSGPRDLAGKRVGLPRGTSAEFFLETLLVRNLVDRASVEVVDVPPAAMAEALEAGRVDAVAIWSPTTIALRRRLGDALVALDAGDVYEETFDVVVRPELLRDRPEAVRRLLRALLAAERFQRAHPGEAARLVAPALGVAPDDAEEVLAPFHEGVWLDQGLVVLLEQQARWAVRRGLAAPGTDPDLQELVRFEPLLAVKPAAVLVLR
jgi:NitT/TauT family transport system substrate-binding protein